MKKIAQKFVIIGLCIYVGFLQVNPVHAIIGTPPPAPATCAPVGSAGVDIQQCANANFYKGSPASIGAFVTSILGQVYAVALIVMLAYLVWGSYRYMMAAGDPKALAAARAHLTWAIVGMIIVFVAYWLFRLVNELTLNVFSDL